MTAADYAQLGYGVFAVLPNAKAPATRNGLRDATTDAAQIAGWPAGHNVGLLPDARTLVLDADSAAEVVRLETEYPELQTAPRCDTPSGGAHIYTRLPDGVAPPKTTVKVKGRALDLRGLGKAYVVAPPSTLPTGCYTWARPLVSPSELPETPAGLLELLTPPKAAPKPSPEEPHAPTGDRARSRYALAALQAEHDRVAAAGSGARNAALNRAAFSLGQLVGSGALDRAEVEDALRAAAQVCGLDPRETEATLKSGLEAGILEPRAVPSSGDRKPFARAADKTATQGQPDLCAFARTDYGAAERLHAAYGSAFRYCGALGYLVWDGTRWKPDENETLMRRMALETARKLFAQAATLKDGDQRESWVKHSLSCERNAALKNAVELVKTIPGVTVEAAQLDRDPMLFNVRNGTLDLNTGLLKDHDPADLITKVAGVDFDLMAECPRWLEFQQTICAGDADLSAFKQRAYGYSLTGMTSEDALFIAHGSGANGKSSELDAIGGILGDYGDTAQFETFAVKKSEGVRNDLAALMGARFVSASEGENRQRLAEGLVKQLTGGDVMKARFLHREFFSFKPEFKLWLATNHKPLIRGTDHGIWRRIRLVPYSVTISEAQRDKGLKKKLEAEKSGILNWLLGGCKIWLEHGLGDAEAVTAATKSYREESDALAEFISACCTVDELHTEFAGELYAAYKQFCERGGEEPFSAQLFGRMLTERGFHGDTVRHAGKAVKIRRGISIFKGGA
jgi:putative DNA primase/helicase